MHLGMHERGYLIELFILILVAKFDLFFDDLLSGALQHSEFTAKFTMMIMPQVSVCRVTIKPSDTNDNDKLI